MKSVETYTATIYCGLRPGYIQAPPYSFEWNRDLARGICQAYCDTVGLGLTLTETTFLYTDGREGGIIVGLINYPRFPKKPEEIRSIALLLAEKLKLALGQERVTVVFTDRTIMLETEEASSANATD